MRTDTPLLKIFQACPDWLFDIAGQPRPKGKCVVKSVTFKALERRADAVAYPARDDEALLAVEFQFQAEAFVMERIVIEVAQLMIDNHPRAVKGVVVVPNHKLAKALKRSPWRKVIEVVCLADALLPMPIDHPMRLALLPLIESNQSKLAALAGVSYGLLRNNPRLTLNQRKTLADVFYSLILERFKTYNREQVNAMLQLPDIRNTVAGQEVFAEGTNAGVIQGKIEGKIEVLVTLARHKFGTLSKTIESSIRQLGAQGVVGLTERILYLKSASELSAWLATAPVRSAKAPQPNVLATKPTPRVTSKARSPAKKASRRSISAHA